MTLTIGLHGPHGVGKSTVARALSNLMGLGCQEVHALDTCYDAVAKLLCIQRDELESPRFKDTPWTFLSAPVPNLRGLTPRDIMNDFGDTLRTIYGHTFFCEVWHRRVEMLRLKVAINSAVRFDYETETMDLVFELTRDGIDYDGTTFNTRLPDKCLTHTISCNAGPAQAAMAIRSYLKDGEYL